MKSPDRLILSAKLALRRIQTHPSAEHPVVVNRLADIEQLAHLLAQDMESGVYGKELNERTEN